jgi:hypothetical protein
MQLLVTIAVAIVVVVVIITLVGVVAVVSLADVGVIIAVAEAVAGTVAVVVIVAVAGVVLAVVAVVTTFLDDPIAILMRLCQPPDGSTSPKYKLLGFLTIMIFFYQEPNELAFNWDTCCHLVICLQLIASHCYSCSC